VKFSQHIIIEVSDEAGLLELFREEGTTPPGLIGLRVLRFRDKPGRYAIQADFDSWESAEKSNELPSTQAAAERLTALVGTQPKYENLDVLLEMAP
jgi:quinol monooxygenase YgiN